MTSRIISLSVLAIGMVTAAFAAGPREDRWKVIGPGGGGAQYAPAISPHDANDVLVHCDMTGTYLSHDGGSTYRMINLRGRSRFYLFDPRDPNVIYIRTSGLFRSTNRGKTWNLVWPPPETVKGIQMPDDHAGERFISSAEPGGMMTALAVDPAQSKTLYAAFQQRGAAAALHISTDWGRSWKKAADLESGADGIYIDPKSPAGDRTIYAIGGGAVSVRRGGIWQRRPAPEGVDAFIETSAGFPKGGGELVVYGTAPSGGFVSEDGGQSWRPVKIAGLAFTPRIGSIAASMHHPEVAYASYDNGRNAAERFFGVARTADGGRTWQVVWDQTKTHPPFNKEAWMPDRNGKGWGRNPERLGVAPEDPDLVFGSDSMRTMRSADGGKSWEAVYSMRLADGSYDTTGLDVTTCYGLHFDPFDPKKMVISYTDIGQFRSDNGGRTWTLSTEGIPREWRNTTYWIVFDPDVKGRAWGVMSGVHDLPRPKMWRGRSPATYNGGLCRSDDGARSWTCLRDALPETAATHILMDPKSPPNARVLYIAAFGRGVYKSVDDGKTWMLKNNGLEGAEPLAWRLAQDAKGVLYLVAARRSSDGSSGNAHDGAIYRSTDGGEHWRKLSLPEGLNGPNGLAIDPENPSRLYLAAWGRATAEGAVDGGIYISGDAGATWRNVLSKDQHIYDVTIDPRNPKVLYAAGFESSAWRSTDRGENWERIRGYNFKWGHRVIPDPNDAAKIYITTFGGSIWHGPAEGDKSAAEDIATPAVAFTR